jgi:hypothetical protein
MVREGYAYIGHVCSKGFSVIDVRDPTKPKTVNYIQNPPNTWSLHLQVHDDLLLLVHGRDMFSQAEMADDAADGPWQACAASGRQDAAGGRARPVSVGHCRYQRCIGCSQSLSPKLKQLQKAKAADRGVRVFASLTQRVQIHIAKLRQDDRVLKFTDRRIADTGEGNGAGARRRH